MMHQGFDCVFDAHKYLSQIKAAGLEFIGRYYFRQSTYKTPLTVEELTAYARAGISVVTVYEGAGDHADYFTLDQGMQDAEAARQQAQALRQPAMSPIYFAVDYDASNEDIDNRIDPYFRAVGKVLGGKYSVGCYGSGLVLSTLLARGLITHQWLSGAMGWRGSRGYEGAQIVQGPQTNLGFGEVDPNVAQGNYGGWMLDADQMSVPDAPPAAPDDPIKTAIGSLQGVLKDAGFYLGAVDGLWGSLSARAMLDYNRSLA